MIKRIAAILAAFILVSSASADVVYFDTDTISIADLIEKDGLIDYYIYWAKDAIRNNPSFDVASMDPQDAAYHVCILEENDTLTIRQCTKVRQTGGLSVYFDIPQDIQPSRYLLQMFATCAVNVSENLLKHPDIDKVFLFIEQQQRDEYGRLSNVTIFQANMDQRNRKKINWT